MASSDLLVITSENLEFHDKILYQQKNSHPSEIKISIRMSQKNRYVLQTKYIIIKSKILKKKLKSVFSCGISSEISELQQRNITLKRLFQKKNVSSAKF